MFHTSGWLSMSIIGYGICFKNGRMHGWFRHVDYGGNKNYISIYYISFQYTWNTLCIWSIWRSSSFSKNLHFGTWRKDCSPGQLFRSNLLMFFHALNCTAIYYGMKCILNMCRIFGITTFQTWVFLYTSDGGCVRFGLSECCLLNLEPFQPFHCHCGFICL